MADAVSVEVADGIGVITINRPEARNAVNEAVARGIAAAIDELDDRREVTSLILTGAGGTFCAGMDLKGFLTGENPRPAAAASAASPSGPPPSRSSRRSRDTRWPAASRSCFPATWSWPARRPCSACPR